MSGPGGSEQVVPTSVHAFAEQLDASLAPLLQQGQDRGGPEPRRTTAHHGRNLAVRRAGEHDEAGRVTR